MTARWKIRFVLEFTWTAGKSASRASSRTLRRSRGSPTSSSSRKNADRVSAKNSSPQCSRIQSCRACGGSCSAQGTRTGCMPGSASSRWRIPNVLWKSVRRTVTNVAVETAAEPKMKTKKIAVIGASGYSGEELVRLLLHHPHAELVAVTSRQYAGQTLAQVFPKFASHPKSKSLRFSEPKAELLAKQAEVVFLALPHGVAAEYAVPLLDAGCGIIDLSADFRLKSAKIYKEFYAHDHPAPDLLPKAVYGLPEIYREQIKKASLVASPGCYPTSILLPVIPLLKAGLVKSTG